MLTLKIAFRNVFRQRRRSLLTGLSMTGGYILFVFSYSLLEGSYSGIIDIFTLDNTGHIQIHKDDYLDRPKIYKSIQASTELENYLSNHDEVLSFTPRVFSPALAYAGDKTVPSRVIGVDPTLEPKVTRLEEKVSDGKYFDTSPNADGHFQSMIGKGVAISLDLEIGDEIILISQGADGSIANDIFSVSAVIGNRTSFDRMAVYLPLSVAQEFLSLGNDLHEYAILVHDDKNNEKIARVLQEQLPNLTVSPWQIVEATFYRTMQSDKQGNYFGMALVVFIVFIGVLNTVLMSVLERTREFGVLRAIGCRPGELVKMIAMETLLLTTLSMVIGILMVTPIIFWFSEVGIALPAPVDMGGISFQYMKGEFASYVFLHPMIFMWITALIISIPPSIRVIRITPKDALGAY